MPEPEILGTPHSNFTWTTRIVCVEKGAPYVHALLRPHIPEVDRISPFGLIPVMPAYSRWGRQAPGSQVGAIKRCGPTARCVVSMV